MRMSTFFALCASAAVFCVFYFLPAIRVAQADPFVLSVTVIGTGSGSVTSNPAGITCPIGVCSAAFSNGTVVTLTASAGAGQTFAGWGGDVDCTDGIVTIRGHRSCTASFANTVPTTPTNTPVPPTATPTTASPTNTPTTAPPTSTPTNTPVPPTATATSTPAAWPTVVTTNTVFSLATLAQPAYLTPVTDPVFGGKITRVGGNNGVGFTALNGTGTWGNDVRHHYGTDQAWNADETLIAIQNYGGSANPAQVYLDATTYQPKYKQCAGYSPYDDRWHNDPAQANIRVAVSSGSALLEWYDVAACAQARAWTLPFISDGDMGQQPTANTGYIALWDSEEDGNHGHPNEAYIMDMDNYPTLRVGPTLNLATGCGKGGGCTVDNIQISPDANYLVVQYVDDDAMRVFDIADPSLALTPRVYSAGNPKCVSDEDPTTGYVWSVGHFGLTKNPYDGGAEYIVGQTRSWCPTRSGVSLGEELMIRLSDGAVTNVSNPSNEAASYHFSSVNYLRLGWFFVSHWPGDGSRRYGDEIVSFRMDLGRVERWAQTHSDTSSGCYRCEQHPVPNRSGTKVIFVSSWSLNCGGTCGSQSSPKSFIVEAP